MEYSRRPPRGSVTQTPRAKKGEARLESKGQARLLASANHSIAQFLPCLLGPESSKARGFIETPLHERAPTSCWRPQESDAAEKKRKQSEKKKRRETE